MSIFAYKNYLERSTQIFSILKEKLKSNGFIIGVEVDPPRATDVSPLLEKIKSLAPLVDFFGVSDNILAKYRVSALSLGHIIKSVYNTEILIHFSARDRNLIAIYSELLGAHVLGVRMLLLINGDPTELSDLKATTVKDVDTIGLINIVKKLNEGEDIAGNKLDGKTDFIIATSFNPLEEESVAISKLYAKKSAGANLVITQPIYIEDYLYKLKEYTEKVNISCLIGILPIISEKNALYLIKNVPGINIPQSFLEKIKNKSPKDIQKYSIELSIKLLEKSKSIGINGTYIMPVLDKFYMAEEIIKAIR